MAIQPIQFPQYQVNSAADFSGLAKLGDVIKQGRIDEMRKQAIQQYGQGNPQALLQGGDLQLANLYVQDQARSQAAQRDVRDFAFRQDEAARAQRNADRSAGLQERGVTRLERESEEPPEGFQKKSTGQPGYEPVPGGPADPAYLEQKRAATPRQMSVSDVSKLSEEGGKLADVSRFTESFRPEFGGKLITGGASNIAGSYLPEGVVGKNVAEGAAWWQGYDRYKNVVRNELFGSALTPGEKAAFEQADINPRMDAVQIKRNLALQQKLTERGVQRKAAALIEQGYSPEVISRAYGIKFPGRAGSASASTAPADPNAVGSGGAVDWQSYFGGR